MDSYPDKTRGVLNEGGLFGEREGWHLPGFNTASWTKRDLSEGLQDGAGVGFFVTTFNLDIPSGVDPMISFQFDNSTLPYRALLFVNGWQFGKVRHELLQLSSMLTIVYTESREYRPADSIPCPSRYLKHQRRKVSSFLSLSIDRF